MPFVPTLQSFSAEPRSQLLSGDALAMVRYGETKVKRGLVWHRTAVQVVLFLSAGWSCCKPQLRCLWPALSQAQAMLRRAARTSTAQPQQQRRRVPTADQLVAGFPGGEVADNGDNAAAGAADAVGGAVGDAAGASGGSQQPLLDDGEESDSLSWASDGELM